MPIAIGSIHCFYPFVPSSPASFPESARARERERDQARSCCSCQQLLPPLPHKTTESPGLESLSSLFSANLLLPLFSRSLQHQHPTQQILQSLPKSSCSRARSILLTPPALASSQSLWY